MHKTQNFENWMNFVIYKNILYGFYSGVTYAAHKPPSTINSDPVI